MISLLLLDYLIIKKKKMHAKICLKTKTGKGLRCFLRFGVSFLTIMANCMVAFKLF